MDNIQYATESNELYDISDIVLEVNLTFSGGLFSFKLKINPNGNFTCKIMSGFHSYDSEIRQTFTTLEYEMFLSNQLRFVIQKTASKMQHVY